MKKIHTKTLGTLALIGAPFLFLGLTYEQLQQTPALGNTRLGGAYSLIYMAGWMCSLWGLLRLKATGSGWFGHGIVWVNLGTLGLANIQNLAHLLLPIQLSGYVRLVLDPFWPISHVLMLVIGVAVIRAKQLASWRRYVPLAIGLWLPIALATKFLFPKAEEAFFYIMAFYTTVAWSFLALAVRTTPESAPPPVPKPDYQLA